MKMKLVSVASWVTLSGAFAISLLVAYWLVWPDEVMRITSVGNAPTDQQVYYPGDEVRYTFSYCKTRPIIGTVSRALVDGTRSSFATIQSDLPAGCHELNVCELRLPRSLSPGKYHIEIAGEYQINPLRTLVVRLQTEEFSVVEDPDSEISQLRRIMRGQQKQADRNTDQIKSLQNQMR